MKRGLGGAALQPLWGIKKRKEKARSDITPDPGGHQGTTTSTRVYRGVWFGFVRFALLLAVGLCWVGRRLDSWVLLGLFCLLRVLHGESSKRQASPRNTKDRKHLQSTRSAQPTHLTDQAPSTTERTARETHNTN